MRPKCSNQSPDPREGYQSSKSSSHLLRSILQHFYRLEDTSDREPMQVSNPNPDVLENADQPITGLYKAQTLAN